MPKLLTQLVTNNVSSIAASTGAGGGAGGASYDVSVLATGQSTTNNNYGNLSYSNVSTVQHGTFENGTATASNAGGAYSTNSTATCRFTFNTSGVYVVEFVSYAPNNTGGFHFIDVHRNGSTVRDEMICYVGIYASFNRKSATAIREFNSGDALTFFTRASNDESDKVGRILIAKIG